MRPLSISRIDEPQVRDNFKAVEAEFNSNPLLTGEWRLIEREFTSTGNFSINHRLGFKPLDMITTFSTASFTADMAKATDQSLEVTVTVVGKVRLLLGRMK